MMLEHVKVIVIATVIVFVIAIYHDKYNDSCYDKHNDRLL